MKIMKLSLIVLMLCTISTSKIYTQNAYINDNIVCKKITNDGRIAVAISVPGIPPKNYKAPVAYPTETANILPNVPAFNWSFGCSATSAAMIAGYYDNMGYPNMYNGPTNAGLMPMNNSIWPDWIDSFGATMHQCPLSATHNGLDGRTIDGHVDDYWIGMDEPGPDPWVGGTQHAHGDCTGDYMKTNQWIKPADEINFDGATTFWYWLDNGPMTISDLILSGNFVTDGGYGLLLFYLSRGYTVNNMYNQRIWGHNGISAGFTYANFKAEIDAGRPVLIHVTDHTMVGYGYDDAGGSTTIYIHDTWDHSQHTMTWGGIYYHGTDPLQHKGVTVVELALTTTNIWTGALTNYWNTGANWSLGHIPTSTEDVIIPDINMPCIVDGSDAVCNEILISENAVVEIYDQTLTIYGEANVHGSINLLNSSSRLYVFGDIIWKSGSSSAMTGNSRIYAYNDWAFNSGSNVQHDAGHVEFVGTSPSDFKSHENNCYLNNLVCNKNGTYFSVSSQSTADLNIAGNLHINTSGLGTTFICASSYKVNLDGFLNNEEGNIYCWSGKFVFSGDPSAFDFKPNTGDYFNDLTINTSTELTLDNTYSNILMVNGNFRIHGGSIHAPNFTLEIGGDWINEIGDAGFIENTTKVIFNGGDYHQDCSSDVFSELEVNKSLGGSMRIDGNDVTCTTFKIVNGIANINVGKTLTVTNSGSSAFKVEAGGTLVLDHVNEIIDVAGDIRFYDGSALNFSNGKIKCGGDFIVDENSSNDITLAGKLVMNGASDQNLNYKMSSNIFQIGDLTVNKSGGTCYMGPSDLDVNGNLLIMNGTLSCFEEPYSLNSNDIYIAKNWTNNVGESGFIQGAGIFGGRVIFDGGNYPQYISDETFNELELNKTSGGGIRMDGTHVVCDEFDWTAGIIYILNGGSFTADDIYDDGIYGNWILESGAVAYIHNPFEEDDPESGQVDLNGELHIHNGTMYVSGSSSHWPGSNDALIEMSGGVLDFTDCGIDIVENNYTLTENITGGTIRTAGNFECGRNDFHPDGGNFEFYGPEDNIISQVPGSTLYDIVINKSAKGGSPSTVNGNLAGDQGKSNTVVLSSDVTITNNLVINAGSISAMPDETFDLYVGANWSNNVGQGGFIPNTGTVIFNGSNNATILTNETFYNLTIDKSQGGNLQLGWDWDYGVMNDLNINSGAFISNEDAMLKVFGDVNINPGGILDLKPGFELQVDDGSAITVTDGAKIKILGEEANGVLVTNITTGEYSFDVSGIIEASYATFEYMDADGIHIENPGIVAPANPSRRFNNCIFRNGSTDPLSTLLTINNDQIFISPDVYFENTTGLTEYNVRKDYNFGEVTFLNPTGDFAGEDYDKDDFNRLYWSNDVYGNVSYANVINSPLSNIVVNLKDSTIIATAQSDMNGDIMFPNILHGNYHIESTTNEPTGGLSMNDVQYARQYITNQPPGNSLSGLHLLAGDVDSDGSLLMNDVLAMWQQITSSPPGFTPNWIFEEPTVNVTGGMGIQSYQGICTGDTDGSYMPVAK